HDQVFCFTPKGKLIALPRGATAIDFAYAIHTNVGNSAVGAKVNGRMAPLFNELQNGDEVEIVRSDGQIPPPAWESIVVTGKARAASRRATRAATRRQYAGLGRQIVERAFQRAAKPFSDEKLKGALPRLARGSIEDVLAAVGRGEMFSGDVVRGVYPDYKDERRAGDVREDGRSAGGRTDAGGGDDAIPIRGLDSEVPVRFSPDGGAVPGDRIVGILTPGQGVTIYPIQSRALAEYDNDPDRWIDVRWDVEAGAGRRFPARIALQSLNEPGSLAQVAQVIADHDGNIENVSMHRRTQDFTEVTVDLSVFDLKHLTAIISELRAKPVVSRVERVVG
ncbi:MAG: bifunctional (p)ppGpp synthetase/guanosine-3',5'-bis(diphosphate) 3'-pyrophosphohydrolase, partial [Methylobacteriaceae bacterium]|nr:bifunctional (p)ppGpp synthetase/guanosine-3',5'-bis(diphosphate) 3'-pyrophosphohydrolase [Methylobacteriaceae bacterium]